jgi:spore coat polysaccharide biosynthesis protein SpsF
MRVVAIIQARMGSTRLPGKVAALISGKPLLQHVIERVKAAKRVDEIVVATGASVANSPVIAIAQGCGVSVYLGNETDVLDRFYRCAESFNATHIVRITADDAFKDPAMIDRVVDTLLATGADYASNTIEPTFPLGIDVEAFTFDALRRAHKAATEPYDREHVTPYIYNHPTLFKLASVKLSDLRWTCDTREDLEWIQRIYSRLYKEGEVFSMADVLNLLDRHPELVRLNKE